MDTAANKSPKKTYSTPELIVYGTVAELTKTVGPHGTRDGGIRGAQRTHV